MGQAEVIEWLSNQRIKGINEFFTIREIEQGLKEMGCTNGQLKKVGENCLKLNFFGIVEYKGVMLKKFQHRKLFRIKKHSIKR